MKAKDMMKKWVVLAAVVCAAVAAQAGTVAQIVTGTTTNTYTTIAAAFAAAQNGDTITMIDDVEFVFTNSTYITIDEGRKITFDLNGKVIWSGTTYNGSSYLIYNLGDLTIMDSAGKDDDGYFKGMLLHGANPTWIYDGSGSYAGSYNSTVIANSGSAILTINGGRVQMVSTGSAAYALENHSWGTPMGSKVQIVINDADVFSAVNAIRLYEGAAYTGMNELTVNDGYIYGGYAGLLIQASSSITTDAPNCTVTINGGTVYGDEYSFYDYSFGQLLTGNNYYLNGGRCKPCIYSFGSNVHVNGGEYYILILNKDSYGINDIGIFDGLFDRYLAIYPYLPESDIKVVTGGLYRYVNIGSWLLSTYVEDGYVVCDNKDASTSSYYPYQVKQAVASITEGTNTVYYGWMTDAFAAVSTNQTIDVWTNNAEDIVVDYDFSFSVDSHGNKLTGKVTIPADWKWVRHGTVCTYVPRVYVAQIVTGGETNRYEAFSAALAAVKDGEVIEMLENLAIDVPIAITNGAPAFTLDLNHHVVTGEVYLAAGRTFSVSNAWPLALFTVTTEVKPTSTEEAGKVAVTTSPMSPIFFQSSTNAYWATTNAAGQVALAMTANPVVKTDDGKEVEIEIPQEWRDTQNVTGEEIMRPEQPMDNGMPAWQNYVLGIDPTNVLSGVYADMPQNTNATVVTIETMNINTNNIVEGYGLRYQLEKVETGETKEQDSPSFDVSLEESDPTGHYQLRAIIYKDGDELDQKAEAINEVGLVKQTQVATNAIVSVPWGKLAPGTNEWIAISNVVKTANLDPGDELRVYRPGATKYESWVLDENKQWQKVMTISISDGGTEMTLSSDPEDATIPRGSGIWLCRKDPSKPYYLYGQVNGILSEVELVKGPNLVGATGIGDYDFNVHIKGAKEGDKIVVPGADGVAPKVFEVKDGAWGYMKSTTVKRGSRTFIQNNWTTDESFVPAGTGFWLHNNSGSITVL